MEMRWGRHLSKWSYFTLMAKMSTGWGYKWSERNEQTTSSVCWVCEWDGDVTSERECLAGANGGISLWCNDQLLARILIKDSAKTLFTCLRSSSLGAIIISSNSSRDPAESVSVCSRYNKNPTQRGWDLIENAPKITRGAHGARQIGLIGRNPYIPTRPPAINWSFNSPSNCGYYGGTTLRFWC